MILSNFHHVQNKHKDLSRCATIRNEEKERESGAKKQQRKIIEKREKNCNIKISTRNRNFNYIDFLGKPRYFKFEIFLPNNLI